MFRSNGQEDPVLRKPHFQLAAFNPFSDRRWQQGIARGAGRRDLLLIRGYEQHVGMLRGLLRPAAKRQGQDAQAADPPKMEKTPVFESHGKRRSWMLSQIHCNGIGPQRRVGPACRASLGAGR